VSGGSGIWAGSGGPSTYFTKPSWQSAPGVPSDGFRDTPDVSLNAASNVGYVVFSEYNPGSGSLDVYSGTSVAAPSFAGIMALVVQKTGARQGNPNPVLYRLAQSQYAGGGPAVFHDVTKGNNSVPGVTGFSAGPGYDLATGLGSVDATALVNNFAVSPGPVANFSFAPSLPVAGQTIQFADTSTGGPASWSWDFGDGFSSTAQNPTHVYATAGAFAVTLTASNTSGSNRATKTVTVASAGASPCVEDAATMCLVGGRYQIRSHWRDQYAGGAVSTLSKAKLTDVTGAFWQSDASTYEYLIRFNTATNNGRIWIAIPTFTDVEFFVDVTDTQTGQSYEYHSPPGNRTLLYDPYTFVYP
jgi:PKD repeat protein